MQAGIQSLAGQTLGAKPNERKNFLAQLKNNHKTKHNLTLDKLKSTYKATEFDQEATKPQGDLIEDRDSDSDFQEEEVVRATKDWDDEENYIGSQEQEEDAGEEHEEEQEEAEESAKEEVAESEASEIVGRRRKQKKASATSSQRVRAKREQKSKV